MKARGFSEIDRIRDNRKIALGSRIVTQSALFSLTCCIGDFASSARPAQENVSTKLIHRRCSNCSCAYQPNLCTVIHLHGRTLTHSGSLCHTEHTLFENGCTRIVFAFTRKSRNASAFFD